MAEKTFNQKDGNKSCTRPSQPEKHLGISKSLQKSDSVRLMPWPLHDKIFQYKKTQAIVVIAKMKKNGQ